MLDRFPEFSRTILWGSLMLASPMVSPAIDDEVIVSSGGVEVRLSDVDVRVNRVPADMRASFMDDPRRVEKVLEDLLLQKRLAAKAREAGIDKAEDFARELRFAEEEILARRFLEHVQRTAPRPNFEAAARERYLADSTIGLIPEVREVSHILVSTQNRSEDEALAKARLLRAQVIADPSRFEAIAERESDDPSARNNRGRLGFLRPDFADEFRAAAQRLTKVGEISEPVRTVFGFHLIRLDALHPERRRSFEEMKAELVIEMERSWLSQVRQRVIDEIRAEPMEVNRDVVASLRWRFLPPDRAEQRRREYEIWKKDSEMN